MTSEWRYALKPLPVDPSVKKQAAAMRARDRTGASQRERQVSPAVDIPTEARVARIVRGLRARVTEPELEEQDCAPDVDPSRRN